MAIAPALYAASYFHGDRERALDWIGRGQRATQKRWHAKLDDSQRLLHSFTETGRGGRIEALLPGGRLPERCDRLCVDRLAVGSRQLGGELLVVLFRQVGLHIASPVDLAALDDCPFAKHPPCKEPSSEKFAISRVESHVGDRVNRVQGLSRWAARPTHPAKRSIRRHLRCLDSAPVLRSCQRLAVRILFMQSANLPNRDAGMVVV